ncbi:MAG: rhomboid family intramembrane serine protease [Gammaproteobacteria bacterium]|nr:rhomboid family intramembrane serine protease [Gammaproteobacteria bacterium]
MTNQTPQTDTHHLKQSFKIAAAFTVVLWSTKIIEVALGASLGQYGVYPGQLSGLIGILLSPLIHSSFLHLLANTAPLLILGTALLYGYPKSAKIVIPAVYFGSGLCVWLFAREAYHIGASGLSFGFMFFVFTIGALRWDRRAIALSLIVFFLYGGMIWGIFPSKAGISFESHFFGAMIGLILAVVLRHHDPYSPEKHYDWEEDDVTELESDQGAINETVRKPNQTPADRNH